MELNFWTWTSLSHGRWYQTLLHCFSHSRKVLWLKVGRTNRDPRVVAAYYLDYVRHMNGVPRLVSFIVLVICPGLAKQIIYSSLYDKKYIGSRLYQIHQKEKTSFTMCLEAIFSIDMYWYFKFIQVRMDRGTENVVIADMQVAFRWNHDDNRSGNKSVLLGKSSANQACIAFWVPYVKSNIFHLSGSKTKQIHMYFPITCRLVRY